MAQKLADLIKNKSGDDEINIEDLKQIYDSITDEYKNVGHNNKVDDDDDQRTSYLIPIITSLCELSRETLANKKLLDHELYVVICNKLSDILLQWTNEQDLNEIKSEYFKNIAQLLDIFARWDGGSEKETIEKIVLDEKFTKPISLCLSFINENDSLVLNDKMNNIRNFSKLIKSMMHFTNDEPMDESHLVLLLNSMMNYIHIHYDLNLIFFDLDNNQQENKFHLLSSCLQYFIYYRGKHRDDIDQQFMEKSFEKLKQIIEYVGQKIQEWTKEITSRIFVDVIKVLNSLCQCESCISIISRDDIIIQGLIGIICNMDLHEQIKSKSDDRMASILIDEIASVLFKMIKDNEKLLITLKNHRTIKETLIDFSQIWGYNVPLVIYQILSDDEIKSLFDIKSLIKSLTHFLTDYTDGQSFYEDIINFLTALTVLAVHEDARKEFVRLGGLETLIKCTIINDEYRTSDGKRKLINPNIIRSRSLNLLWILACDKEVVATIRLMHPNIIQHLQEKISEENQTIAKNVILKLEEKSTRI